MPKAYWCCLITSFWRLIESVTRSDSCKSTVSLSLCWKTRKIMQMHHIKEIEIIHRLFLVIAMYCQASLINHSTSHVASWLGRKPRYMQYVSSNSLEITYVLFQFPYTTLEWSHLYKSIHIFVPMLFSKWSATIWQYFSMNFS